MYLWHYPVFALFRQLDINSDIFIKHEYKIILVIIVFLLSILSYRFIERPFRDKNKVSNNALIILLSVSIMFIVVFSISAINTKGFKNRFNDFYSVYKNFEIDNRYLQLQWNKTFKSFYSKNSKPFTSSKKTKKIIFVGNSHAVGYFNAFNLNQELFNDYEFSLLRINLDQLKKYKDTLINFNESEYIVIATRYDLTLIDSNSSEKLEKYIDEWNSFLKINNKELIVFLNRPEFPLNSKNNYTPLDKKVYKKIKDKNKNLKGFKKKFLKNILIYNKTM